MNVKTERTGGILIAKTQGRIDSANALDFEDAMNSAMGSEDRTIVMDLGGLTYISSAGLRVILVIAKTLRKRKVELILCSLSKQTQEVFEMSGFDKIVPIEASREEALAKIAG